jgi:ATP-dependent Clp protease ATP-binding subunit ClpX
VIVQSTCQRCQPASPNTGSVAARGLRTTIEEILLDVMYEIPSMENVRKCIVDENVIRNHSRPLLMTVADQKIPYDESA